MSSDSSEKIKSKESKGSMTTYLALLLIAFSIYQLGPDALKMGRKFWTKTSCRLKPPHGHLKPLGQQAPPLPPVPEMTEWPKPEDFYRDLVAPNKPVIFRGMAKTIPAYYKWTDEYLRKEFGHEEVAVEIGLKQKDYEDHLYLNVMSEFLKSYKDKAIYLVDTMTPKRFRDVNIPRSLRCGNFLNGLSDVIMWLSNGNTKSIIHRDYVDNINCILDGKKLVHLFKRDYTDNHQRDFSRTTLMDVDQIDLCEFPSLAEAPRYEITVETGDCFFLPFQWYHYVVANNARNLGVNYWFQHLMWFNESDCQGKDVDGEFPFGADNMPTMSKLKQYELITFAGNKKTLTLENYLKHYLELNIGNKERLTELFHKADRNDDGLLSMAELYSVDTDTFISFFNDYETHRFLNYTRDRGDLDPEEDTTKPKEL